ncbi:MAG: flagellar biosynthesis protein FlhF, partial [Gammaproteobacteria bacterium]
LGQVQEQDPEKRWNETLAHLARAIPVCDIEKKSGPRAVALLGPTGAGKTTTLAKLAARHIREHGREGLVLVTTDRFRVAAAGQLQALGKLLGVPVHVVGEKQRLATVLDELIRPRLVLIDTAGLTASDPNGVTQLRELAECPHHIEKYLVISAVSQAQVMKSNYHYYKMPGLSGCMITKVDEACTLGQALELSIQEHLPVACYTDGQNVARDYHPASGHALVARAVALARQMKEQAPLMAGLAG